MLSRVPSLGTTAASLPVVRLWGDPFANDEWHDIASVVDWNSVDAHELFRFIPHLPKPSVGIWPNRILSALGECLDPWEPITGTAGSSNAIGCHQPYDEDALSLIRAIAGRPVENKPRFSERRALLVARYSGVHPAYFWPEALLSHDRFAMVAWFGFLARFRRALIPLEVARYIVDTTKVERGKAVLSDPSLSAFWPTDAVSGALLHAARRRLTKHSQTFDLDRVAIRMASTFHAWS